MVSHKLSGCKFPPSQKGFAAVRADSFETFIRAGVAGNGLVHHVIAFHPLVQPRRKPEPKWFRRKRREGLCREVGAKANGWFQARDVVGNPSTPWRVLMAMNRNGPRLGNANASAS